MVIKVWLHLVDQFFKGLAIWAALQSCSGFSSSYQVFAHQGKLLHLKGEDGPGGSKSVVHLGDGRLMALFTKGNAQALEQAEATLSQRLSALGLQTQSNISAEEVMGNDTPSHVLFMDRWVDQVALGRQIRDSKNKPSRYGATMLFGTLGEVKAHDF